MIHSPGTFQREKRTTPCNERQNSPGPSSYYANVQDKSPGGCIGKDKRRYLIDERESKNSPGPLDYLPKYHFVAK